jgi:hypothetical protein
LAASGVSRSTNSLGSPLTYEQDDSGDYMEKTGASQTAELEQASKKLKSEKTK